MNYTYFKAAYLLLGISLFSLQSLRAEALNSKDRDPKYVETIVNRSQKIVDNLSIQDQKHSEAVRNIISNRYFELNDIYSKRDDERKQLTEAVIDKELRDAKLQIVDLEKESSLYRSHFAFPAKLSLYLDEEKVTLVKDGMTFGVVNVTNVAYQDMIPSLTVEEKAQINVWLIEARELAMDGETSNKKHEIFKKYKGRINNYLSARGYNLNEERDGWNKRIEAKKAKQ